MACAHEDASTPQTSTPSIKPFVLSSGAAEFRPMCRGVGPPPGAMSPPQFFPAPHFPPLTINGLAGPLAPPTSPQSPSAFFLPPPAFPPPQLVVQHIPPTVDSSTSKSVPQNVNPNQIIKKHQIDQPNTNNNNQNQHQNEHQRAYRTHKQYKKHDKGARRTNSRNRNETQNREPSHEAQQDNHANCDSTERITSYQYSLGPNGGCKEKTPMSQIADLARYNRLCHQYKLLNEAGPAHQKVFSVNLILTDKESYIGKDNITPTVLLNAIAHKHGSVPEYTPLESTSPGPYPPFMMSPDGRYYRAARGCIPVKLFRVLLKLGDEQFIGVGNSRQYAKHDAANNAISYLKTLGVDCDVRGELSRSTSREKCIYGHQNVCDSRCGHNMTVDDFIAHQLKSKSPISLVHEVALSRKLDVTFEVLCETGPAHERVFSVNCTLTSSQSRHTFNQNGQGPSKREAKHAACIAMIKELAKSGPLIITPPECRRPRAPKEIKRKTIIKDVKMDPNYGQQINPVSRLIQIMQIKQEKEPQFTLVAETGMARYKEFTMQVTLHNMTCTGTGPNKKLAKRAAAEAMLLQLGYAKPLPKPGRSVLKQNSCGMFEVFNADDIADNDSNESDSSDTNGESSQNNGNSNEKRKVTFNIEETKAKETAQTPSSVVFMAPRSPSRRNKHQPAADSEEMIKLAREVLSNMKLTEKSGDNDGNDEVGEVWPTDGASICSKHQLAYLSTLVKFTVQYTDFPKQQVSSSGNEYLTLVSVGVSPPLVCHGTGASVEQAHSTAAYTALTKLAQHPSVLSTEEEMKSETD